MARIDRYFDPVQVAQLGRAMLGLEGAEATAAGTVLLWGWLVDPAGELGGLSCQVNGRTAPMELLDRIARPDLEEMLAGVGAGETGFVALARVEPDALEPTGGRAAVTLNTAAGSAASGNRLQLRPELGLAEGVGRRLPLGRMRPAAIARAGEAVVGPEIERSLDRARGAVRSLAFGPAGAASLSLVVPIEGATPLSGEYGTLRQTLAYLDMDPESAGLELVLVLAHDRHWTEVEASVLDAATGLRMRLVRPGRSLSAGAAALIGMEASTAPVIALMAEAVVPPSRGWISDACETAQASRLAAPAAMPRFDGAVHRCQVRTPHAAGASWPHQAVRLQVEEALRRKGLDGWSPHLAVGERDAMLGAAAPAALAGLDDAFWIALLDQIVGAGAVPLASGDRFAFVPGAPREQADGDLDLLEAYLLANRLGAAPEPLAPALAVAAA